MPTFPRVVRLIVLLVPAVIAPSTQGQTDRPLQPLKDQIVQTQASAVDSIRKEQKEDGSFRSKHLKAYPAGVTSLCLLALLDSGVSPHAPDIQRALEFILRQPPRKTYSVAYGIMALDALTNDRAKLVEDVRSSAAWLAKTFRNKGDINKGEIGWGYPEGAPDLSIMQQAAYALHLAKKYGFEFKKKNWRKLAGQVLKYQNEDGGFGYHVRGPTKGSTTSAAITVLTLCEMNGKVTGVRKPIARAWKYLEERFQPFAHPTGAQYTNHHFMYYLASLERACALSEKDTLAGKNWHLECATEIVKAQSNNRGWGVDVSEVALAGLFLARAGHKAIGARDEPPVARDVDTYHGERKPRHTVPFVKSCLIAGPFESRTGIGLTDSDIDEAQIGLKKFKWPRKTRVRKCRSTSDFIDLKAACRGRRGSSAYAFCRFSLREKTVVCFWLMPQACSRMWIDGAPVGDLHLITGEFSNKYCVKKMLEKGNHRLLVKVSKLGGPWGLLLRICRADGSPLAGLVPYTDPEGPTNREYFDARAGNRTLERVFGLIPVDENPALTFRAEGDLDRTYFLRGGFRVPFTWTQDTKGYKGARPPQGAKGVICVHPPGLDRSALVLRKVAIKSNKARLVARVAACDPAHSTRADFLARIGVYTVHEDRTDWLVESRVISTNTKSPKKGWVEILGNLSRYAGKEVLLILECRAGGPGSRWGNEFAFIDEFSVCNN